MRHSLTLRAERMDELTGPEDSALAPVEDDNRQYSPYHEPNPVVVALEQELRDEGLGQGGQVRVRETETDDSRSPMAPPTSTSIISVHPSSQEESRPAQGSPCQTNVDVPEMAPLPELVAMSPEQVHTPLRPPSPSKPTSSATDPLALRHDGATSPNQPSQHMGIDSPNSVTIPGPVQPSGPSHVYEQYTRNLPYGPPPGLSSDPLSRGYPYQGPSDPSPYHIYNQDVHNTSPYGRVVTQQGEVPVVDYYSPYGHHEPLPPYTERDNTGPGGSSSSSASPSPVSVAGTTPSIGQHPASSVVVASLASASALEPTPAVIPGPAAEEPIGGTVPIVQPTQPLQTPLPSTQTATTTQISPITHASATGRTDGAEHTGPAAEAAPTEDLTGAGGLGLATRNPEFDSLDDLRTPRPRASTRSFNTTQSNDQISKEKAAIAETETPFKRWMRKQWCFGVVPNWALVLSLCLLVIVGIVAGTVAGVLLSRHGKRPPRDGPP